MRIVDVHVHNILDSRGEPTIEMQLQTEHFSVKASVPSGKSRGIHEAVPCDPKNASANLDELRPLIASRSFVDQKMFDNFLRQQDGTSDKSRLGANLILSLSLAFARASAQERGIALWKYINETFSHLHGPSPTSFPHLFLNIINGGAHARPSEKWIMRNGEPHLEFQEFHLIPESDEVDVALGMGKELYKKLREALQERFGKNNIELGDEAGFIAPFKDNEDALETLYELIGKYRYPVRIGLDVAASQFFKNGAYTIGDQQYAPSQLTEQYRRLVSRYNLLSIEDPFDEEDFTSFALLTGQTDNKLMIITDDLTTTNPVRLSKAIKKRAGNTILVKPNQIGTLSEVMQVASMARNAGWKMVVSHRSGETEDDFIADLAVGIGAWGLKSGAPDTIYRMSKYQRLVTIFEQFSAS